MPTHEHRQIARSTTIQFFGKAISIVLGIITLSLTLRYLGVHDFGAYSTVVTFVGFFSTLTDLGLYIYLATEISRPGTDTSRLVGSVIALRIVSALFILLVGVGIAWLIPSYSMTIKIGMLLGAMASFAISINQLAVAFFQKSLRTAPIAYAEIVGRIVGLLALVLVVYLHGGVWSVLATLAAGNIVNTMLLHVAARRQLHYKLLWDTTAWRKILQVSWPIAVTVVLNVLYFRLDSVFLSIIHGETETGIYNAAYKVLEVLIAFPAIFAGLLIPLLARHAFGDWKKFRSVLLMGVRYLLLLAVPMVIITQFIAVDVIRLLGGEDFGASGNVLRLLIFPVAFIFLGNLFANAIVAVRLQKPIMVAYAITAIVSVGINLLLIPRFGAFGAAWSTFISEGMMLLCTSVAVLTASRAGAGAAWWSGVRFVVLLAVASLTLVVVLWWSAAWGMWVQLGLGIVVYVAALFATRLVVWKDMRLLLHSSSTT